MQQYKMFELRFRGDAPEHESLAAPQAEFVQNGKTVRVKGFYAGGGIYKVRFYPRETGMVSWRVDSEVTDGGSRIVLTGELTGTCQCEPADKGAAAHGIVRANGLHFAYEDGTRYQAFGTTVYALIHQDRALTDTSFETLAAAPFNKVRFCVFPKHYAYNHNEPEHFAFEKTNDKFDVNRPCYAFWEELERRIIQLDNMGIQGDLILFHPYDRWGFAELSYEECMTYLSYLVRRLAALPNLWWSLANEYDLMGHFQREWWDAFAHFLRENDPYRHLLSNHNCLPYWDFHNPDTTHCCIQDICVNRVGALQRTYGKPVVFDEICYEGNIEFTWGNISAFEMTHRFWTAHILGGYCTHGETYLNQDEVLWWSRGGRLYGESPARIAFLRQIMEELPSDPEVIPGYWDQIVPEERCGTLTQEQAESAWERGISSMPIERLYRLIDRESTMKSRCGEDVYLSYYGRQCCARAELLLPEDGAYDIEVIDIWEMTRETSLTGVGGKVTVSLPGKEGIAVIAWRRGRADQAVDCSTDCSTECNTECSTECMN